MPARARTSTRLAIAVALALALLGAGPLPRAATAETTYRSELLRLLNDSRDRHGLDAVGLDVPLSKAAKKHTSKMVRKNRLMHPADLEEMLRGANYERFGAAAVGCAQTLRGLHRALLRSSVHREILLHPDAEMVGIGVIRTETDNRCGRGSFWATYVFYG